MARRKVPVLNWKGAVVEPPPTGSISEELQQTAPPETPPETAGGVADKPKRGRKPKVVQPEGPSPWSTLGPLTRRVCEPLYTGLGVECPHEAAWIMWAEAGGKCMEYYLPDVTDHPLPLFAVSTLILASPILIKMTERKLGRQSASSRLRVRDSGDRENHPDPNPHAV